MTLRGGFRPLVCAAALSLSVAAGVSLAHGGPPLRLGVTADSAVEAVARLVLVHLREGVGFAVDWREYRDRSALRAAFAAGKLDIAVVLSQPGTGTTDPAPTAATDCPRPTLDGLVEDLTREWRAEAFLLGVSTDPASCVRPALIVSRSVLDDPRFGILGKESGRIAALVTREDLAAVRSARERGGERAATAAARAALAAKAGR